MAALACLLLFSGSRVLGQLSTPVPPVNIIIDSDMAPSVDDVGDHAVMWALANRGEVNVLAEICSSANDYSAPLMHAIATYYGHPNVPIGALKGTTPNLENSATSNYTQQMVSRFGISGDTRANYPDPVVVYRQALANAPDHSVYIVANGYWQPLQGLLQSPADSFSPLTGVQLVAQKVVRLVPGAGFFPSGNEHDMRVDADAASFVYANWPVQIVNVGVEVSLDVNTGPDFSSSTTTDPIKAAYVQFNGGNPVPGFGQLPLLFAVRGLGTNFTVPGFNGQTTIETFSQQTPGQDNWFSTPQVGHSYLAKQATAAQIAAILNPLLQGSSTMPILKSISPSSVAAGSSAQTITLTGTNFFSDSQVQFNGSNRPTTFVSATQVTVQLSSSDLAQAGTPNLTVVNTEGLGWTSSPLTVTINATNPTLTAISPTSAIAGSGPVTLTATGSNFTSASTIQVNGANRTTTFTSSTQLTATLTAADLAVAGSLSITVNTPGGGSSAALNFTVNNPVPSISSISPTAVVAGGADFTLTVNGSNFVSGSLIQVNGAGRTTTFMSSTQLSATITAGDIASAGTLSITVNNATPGGGTSSAVTLTVNNPVPSLSSISPTSATVGGAGFTLTVNGSNFVSGSVVQVNGSGRTTTFVSSTQLTAAIPASDIASTGNLSITVSTAGGGTSSALTLAVVNPVPSLASISPTSTTAGSSGFTLTVNGSNFVSGSVVQVNGSGRTTTFVSSTQITATIAASDIASAGTVSITVNNAAPGGGTSSATTLAVNNPVPSLSSISPTNATVGGAGFTLTVNGSNFVSGSLVQVNGSGRPTTFVSSTQVTAAISASDIASTGNLSITVSNAAPGGGTSSAVTLAVVNPVPSLANISPNNTLAGSAGFTLTVNGSNFISGSVVRVNGANRTTTFVSNTQLTAAIPASDLGVGALLSITVFTAAPGGGSSPAVTFTVNNPVPSISSISPSTALVLGSSFTLTVNGSGFNGASVVQINGSSRPTTFVNPTQLQAQISNNDILVVGQRNITVVNPAPGGGTSNTAILTVVGLLGQVIAPSTEQLAVAQDARPEPFFYPTA
jgi:hypothetical protein